MFRKTEESSENSAEEGEEAKGEEMEINSNSPQANSKWNPNKGRHGWKTKH